MQIRTLMCIGGIPFEDDKRNYCTNGGTVLIGTIGRLLEFVDKKLIKVSELEMVILDEGDIMF
jgi:superfamily II DNA/RNA helicase